MAAPRAEVFAASVLHEIAELLKRELPGGIGFVVTLFDFGEAGWSGYASNGRRADIVKYLRELAAHLEGQ